MGVQMRLREDVPCGKQQADWRHRYELRVRPRSPQQEDGWRNDETKQLGQYIDRLQAWESMGNDVDEMREQKPSFPPTLWR